MNYQVVSIEATHSDVICTVCTGILNVPSVHTQCGFVGCQNCLKQLINCHQCNQSIPVDQIMPAPKVFLNLLKKLVVRCAICEQSFEWKQYCEHRTMSDCYKKACEWCDVMVHSDELIQHQEECSQVVINCSEAANGCSWRSSRRKYMKHTTKCFYATTVQRQQEQSEALQQLTLRNQQLLKQVEKLSNDFRTFTQHMRYDATSKTLHISGVNVQITNSDNPTENSSSTCNGLGNLILGHNKPKNKLDSNSIQSTRNGSHNIVIGDSHEYNGSNSIIIGRQNQLSGNGSIVGGFKNVVTGSYCTALSGINNRVEGWGSCAIGGTLNVLTHDRSVVTACCHFNTEKSCSVTTSKICDMPACSYQSLTTPQASRYILQTDSGETTAKLLGVELSY